MEEIKKLKRSRGADGGKGVREGEEDGTITDSGVNRGSRGEGGGQMKQG